MNNPKVSLTFYESGKVHAELHGVIRDREPQASVKALSFKYFHLFSLCLIVCPQLNSLLQKFDFKSSYQSAGDSILTSKKVKQLEEFQLLLNHLRGQLANSFITTLWKWGQDYISS